MSKCANLRDERTFPTFKSCPDDSDIDLNLYTTADGFSFRPKRHWCLLAEITGVSYIIRPRLTAKDNSGVEFPIAFYLEGDSTALDLSSLRKGYTIAILYPQQHGFLDQTVGIRQEEIGGFKVSA